MECNTASLAACPMCQDSVMVSSSRVETSMDIVTLEHEMMFVRMLKL